MEEIFYKESDNDWEKMFLQTEELNSFGIDEMLISPFCDTSSSDGVDLSTKNNIGSDTSSSNGVNLSSKNIGSERNRRRKLNERLYALRSVVPNITKLDKASIVRDAIEHIKSLQEDERRIEAEISELESGKSPNSVIVEFEQDNLDTTFCSNANGSRMEHCRDLEKIRLSMKYPIEVLELRISPIGEQTLVVSLTCTKRTNTIVKLCELFESLKLKVISSNINAVSGKLLKTLFIEAAAEEKDVLRVKIEAAIAALNDPNRP